MPWRSRWSSLTLSSSAHSGANAEASSSWKLDASQTTVAAGSMLPTSEASGVPTFPATSAGTPASSWIAPSSTTVVVLPFVPVTAMNSFGRRRQASSSSPTTSRPRSRAATITGASCGTPGLFTTVRARSSRSSPSERRRTSTPSSESAAGGLGEVAAHHLPVLAQHQRGGHA